VLHLVAFFLVGIFASFIGAIAGGTGLISIPISMLLGLPPQIAIASNKVGGIGTNLGAAARFWKSGYIVWKYVLAFSLMGIAGGFIGANILLEIGPALLNRSIGLILVVSAALMLTNRQVGTKEQKSSRFQKIIGSIIYFATFVYGGLFGGGAGIVILYILTGFFGLTLLEANATNTIAWVCLTVTSVIVFAAHGAIDFSAGIPLFVGMICGGYLGAHTAIKKGDAWVKGVLITVSLVFAIKLLFF